MGIFDIWVKKSLKETKRESTLNTSDRTSGMPSGKQKSFLCRFTSFKILQEDFLDCWINGRFHSGLVEAQETGFHENNDVS